MSQVIRCPRCKLTREQLIAQLETEVAGVARMRLARTLAHEFISYYGIFPYGVNLIPWLTHSRCRTNAEALVCWIEHQLEDPGFAEFVVETEPAIVLAHRLLRLLATVEASCAQ
jgi:hypothetical protein